MLFRILSLVDFSCDQVQHQLQKLRPKIIFSLDSLDIKIPGIQFKGLNRVTDTYLRLIIILALCSITSKYDYDCMIDTVFMYIQTTMV